MSIWKKAISAGLTAMLLASLTASATFATKGAAGESDQTDALACTAAAVATAASCSQVADGISTVTLGGDPTLATAGNSLYISAAGASMIAATGDFTLTGGIVTTGTAPTLTATGDTITVRAPAAPGTATVSVYMISTTTGIATLEGTLTITFTATSGLALSEANSTVKIVNDATCVSTTAITSAAASPSNTKVADLCIVLKDGNGSTLAASAATVAVTITPVGLVDNGTIRGQTVSKANGAAGVANFSIYSSGLPGTAVIGISVTQGTTTTTFAPKTFIFTGALASLTVTQTKFAIAKGVLVTNPTTIGTVVGKDAAGNALACDTTWVAKSGTTTVIADANLDVVVATDCDINIISGPTPATLGSTAITVQTADASIKAAPFTLYVSDVTATVTVTFSAATIAPGGSATITVTAKDSGGRPVADGQTPTVIVSSGAITAPGATSNGKATITYLAPFNTGVVTALATLGGVTGSGSANVSTPVVISAASAASALGVTTAGPFTTTTKVAALGKYVTVKMSFGASAAGATVVIWTASKNSAGVWSAFTAKTSRIANSNGDVYFYWRSSSAAWLSIQGRTSSASANAVQARWK